MKNIKLTGILVSAGLVIVLCTGLLAYNSNKENVKKDTQLVNSTVSPNINTQTTDDKESETIDTPTTEEDNLSSQSNDSIKISSTQPTSPNSTKQSNSTGNSNNPTIDTNIPEKDTITNDSNNNNSNNNTDSNHSTGIQPKPEVDKPIVTPPTTNVPDVENTKPPTPSANFVSQIEQAIFQQVNIERSNNGLPSLSYNNTMQKYARIKSQDMGDRDYFSHENPEGQLITTQMQKDGVSYQAWGENIAYIQSSASNGSLANQFMTNWMNSPGHRANILSNDFSSIGIGVYKVGNTYYATQEFYN